MKIIKPYFEIRSDIDGKSALKHIAWAGRTCYKSEPIGTDTDFVARLIERGHESVLEHVSITVLIVCDRGISHELVRHRIASYSQESTRYCNYAHDRFGNELTFIDPCFWEEGSELYAKWLRQMEFAEIAYLEMISKGVSAEQARSILPNSLKTEVVVTMNLRAWRHFFKLRTSEQAHPQMREISIPLLAEFKKRIPVVFDDINYKEVKGVAG